MGATYTVGLNGTRLHYKNVLLACGMVMVYSIALVPLLTILCISFFGGENISEEGIGGLMVIPVLICAHYVFNKKWPFTKSLDIHKSEK